MRRLAYIADPLCKSLHFLRVMFVFKIYRFAAKTFTAHLSAC